MAALEQKTGPDRSEGSAPPRSRVTVHLATGSAILAGLAGLLFLVTGSGAACGPGRTCVTDAGLSVVLPDGWSATGTEDQEIFRAVSSSPSVGIIINPGDARLPGGSYRTLDDVAAAVATDFARGKPIFFGQIGESVVDRQTLPIGPAVRDRMTTTQNFILSFNQSSTIYWFFADGRLLELEYDVAAGEEPPFLPPATETLDMQSILTSLRPMTGAMGTALVSLRRARRSRREEASHALSHDFWDGKQWR